MTEEMEKDIQAAYEQGFADGCRLATRTLLAKVMLVLNDEMNLDDQQMKDICRSINDRLLEDLAAHGSVEDQKE